MSAAPCSPPLFRSSASTSNAIARGSRLTRRHSADRMDAGTPMRVILQSPLPPLRLSSILLKKLCDATCRSADFELLLSPARNSDDELHRGERGKSSERAAAHSPFMRSTIKEALNIRHPYQGMMSTLLELAVRTQPPSVAAWLIQAGADVCAFNYTTRFTALHVAVAHASAAHVLALLENGAPVDAETHSGATAQELIGVARYAPDQMAKERIFAVWTLDFCAQRLDGRPTAAEALQLPRSMRNQLQTILLCHVRLRAQCQSQETVTFGDIPQLPLMSILRYWFLFERQLILDQC